MNNILCFASKYLKRTFENKSYEIVSIKYVPGMKYLLDTVYLVQYFASLKQAFEKGHMKLGPSNMVLI